MILDTLKKYCTKRNLLFVGVFTLLYFVLSDIALAAETPATTQPTDTNKLITGLHGAMQIVGALLGTVTALVTLLLNPGWYNGEVFNLQVYFKHVWILVSNVVYFIFAFVLIWIAFMNIIGKTGDNYEIKKALPKLFVGVLIVPFSWFLVQFIVSISNILMVGILSLPFDTFKDFKEMQDIPGEICTKFTIDVGGAPNSTTNNAAADPNKPVKWYECTGGQQKVNDLIKNPKSVFNIISIYTYGILRLDKLNEVTLENIKGVKTLGGLAVKVIFDMIFVLVYAILMLAIFIALFMRGVWIWMYMMLSPLFGLMYFFDKHEGVGEFGHFNIKEFIKLAMVPVYVGGALSFGILFIFVTSKGFEVGTGVANEGGKKLIDCKPQENTCTITVFEFEFTIKGAGKAGSAVGEAADFTATALGGIIINLFGIAVLWIAVMAALNSSEITKSLVEPIAGFGKSIGETVMKAPQYMPLLPGPGGGLSASALGKVGGNIKNIPEQLVSEQAKPWEKSINNAFGVNSMTSSEQTNILAKIRTASSDTARAEAQQQVLQALKQYSSKDQRARELLVEYAQNVAKQYGLKPEDVTMDKLFDKDGGITERGYQVLTTKPESGRPLRTDTTGFSNFRTALKEKETSGNATPDIQGGTVTNQISVVNTIEDKTAKERTLTLGLANGATSDLKIDIADPKKATIKSGDLTPIKGKFSEVDFRRVLKEGGVTGDEQNSLIKSLGSDFFLKPKP